MRRVLTAAAAAMVVATTMLTGTAGDAVAAERASARPSVGECRDLTRDQLADASNTTAPMSCADPHTARTFAVVDVSRKLSKLTGKEIRKVGEAQCTPKFVNLIGGWRTRIKTAYFFVFYTPTNAQQRNGENWIRCDLVLSKGKFLAKLPNNSTPVVSGSNVNTNARACVSSKYRLTVCAEAHTWSPAGAFAIKRREKPTAWQVGNLAEDHCKKIVGSARFTYVNWLSEWNSGNKLVMCFKRTA